MGDSCPFLTPDGCEVYLDRPAICRLFGAVDSPFLQCPVGACAKRPMTDLASHSLLEAIRKEGA